MARKRKLQQKRAEEIGSQVEESIRQDGEDAKYQMAASDQLFQIDAVGGQAAQVPARQLKKQKFLEKNPLIKSKKFDASKANKSELEAIKKLQQKLQKPTQQPVKTNSSKKNSKQKNVAPNAATDLVWGSDGKAQDDPRLGQYDEEIATIVVPPKSKPKRVSSTKYKVAKVEVAQPGQSYHPEFEAHQDTLAEAVAQELEKQEKRRQLAEPISKGLSEETLQYIDTRGSDEESESSEEEQDESINQTTQKSRRQREKVTQTQRNRRARHKQLQFAQQAKKANQKLLKQIKNVPQILSEIVSEEAQNEQKQKLQKLRKEQQLQEEPFVRVNGRLTRIQRDVQVSLSTELSGNLRALKPKGNPLAERLDSLRRRNMLEVTVAGQKPPPRKVKIIET